VEEPSLAFDRLLILANIGDMTTQYRFAGGGSRMNFGKQHLALLLPVVALLFSLPGSIPIQPLENAELQAALTKVASDSLKDEYDVLVTGRQPEQSLIPQRDCVARFYVEGKERIATALRMRAAAAKSGMNFSSIDITLTPKGIDEINGRIILHAIEEKVEHFNFITPPTDGRPQVTESRINHDFVFSVAAAPDCDGTAPYSVCLSGERFLLIEDIIEPQLLHQGHRDFTIKH
jgi:hypothetical protein